MAIDLMRGWISLSLYSLEPSIIFSACSKLFRANWTLRYASLCFAITAIACFRAMATGDSLWPCLASSEALRDGL
jgi:hypothetical protein